VAGVGSSGVGAGLALVALALWVVVAAYLINALSSTNTRGDVDFFGKNYEIIGHIIPAQIRLHTGKTPKAISKSNHNKYTFTADLKAAIYLYPWFFSTYKHIINYCTSLIQKMFCYFNSEYAETFFRVCETYFGTKTMRLGWISYKKANEL
jgi:hypothetical protein